ncbi:HAD hydrolase-like protein [Saccharothrix sp. BKS2]|uniref:HAD hydrolase-like protein n=1 Tax=Saccharothrix sp. BKS2 TaxID=3064400 RepID=UPI0039EA09A7
MGQSRRQHPGRVPPGHGEAQRVIGGFTRYGDDHTVRAELVRIARDRAAERTGVLFDRTDTVLIGDTARDVEAAHAAGVHVIAMASGRPDVAELRAAGAVDVLEDLTGIDRVRPALTR